MARKQKLEKEIIVSAAAAAPAPRRKAVTAKRVKHTPPQAEAPATSRVEVSASEPAAVAEPFAPAFEEISQVAYSYWEARGCQGGDPEEDWLRAEQELRDRVPA
jgi:hypothetical protein